MKRKPAKRTEAWSADHGVCLAYDLQGKLRDGDAIPEDASDCVEDVHACLSGAHGKAAMKAFTRTLQRLMTEHELECCLSEAEGAMKLAKDPRADMIQALRYFLQEVKAGNVDRIALVALQSDGEHCSYLSGLCNTTPELTRDLVLELYERVDNEAATRVTGRPTLHLVVDNARDGTA